MSTLKLIHKIVKPFAIFTDYTHRFLRDTILNSYYTSRLGYCGKNVVLRNPNAYTRLSRMYMYDNTSLFEGFNFISYTGKFIMKQNSGAAQNLTIVTGNHHRVLGVWMKSASINRLYDEEKDVVVEEDVWIGINVTLLSGVTVGRGATIGAGAVCTLNVPPYAIMKGNPAKVVGFNYTPEEVIEHEKALYPESERIPIELLEKNYDKYFLKRLKEIKEFMRK